MLPATGTDQAIDPPERVTARGEKSERRVLRAVEKPVGYFLGSRYCVRGWVFGGWWVVGAAGLVGVDSTTLHTLGMDLGANENRSQ